MIPAPLDLAAGEDAGAAHARFAEARGRRVFEAGGVLFGEYRPPFFISLPWQRRVDLDPVVLGAAMRRARVWAVRYPSRSQPGWPCGLYVLRLPGFDLSRLAHDRRRRARRGLDVTTCRLLDPEELETLGLELNLQTMARQHRHDPEFADPPRWRRFVAAVRMCPEVEVAGGFVEGRLATYNVSLREGGWLHLLYKAVRTEDLRLNAALALECWTLERGGRDPTLLFAECGFAPVASGDTVDAYKRELGFSLVPFDLAVRFHPLLAPLLASRTPAALAGALSRLRPRSKTLDLASHLLAGARRTRLADPLPAR